MIDLAHDFDAGSYSGDLVFENGLLGADQGLKTAVLHSLFSDARVSLAQAKKVGSTDPRGWWGAALDSEQPDNYGSKLWLLSREKQTDETLQNAVSFGQEALEWMIEDGVVSTVTVEAEWKDTAALALRIDLKLPSGEVESYDFDYPWSS